MLAPAPVAVGVIVNNSSNGLYVANGTATVVNCTIASNANWGITNAGTLTVRNSIVWLNKTGGITSNATTAVTCTDAQDAWCTNGLNPGTNLCADPLFVDLVYFHEQSKAGDYTNGYFSGGGWGAGLSNSPCIDAGEPYPASSYALEPEPNGRRINLGAYGNTAVASLSAQSRGTVITLR